MALSLTLLQRPRIALYRALSTCRRVSGDPLRLQPLLLLGPGAITVGRGVVFGWPTAGRFLTSCCQLEASTAHAAIEIGDRVEFSNDVLLKSEGPGIVIGADALIGSQVTIYDSDFHDLRPERRRGGTPALGRVEIGENVFVGDGVRILKGVRIGRDSVIGAGSVVVGSIPAGVIAAGNPARVVRSLDRVEDPGAAAR